ncbi:MAG: hypothetical protein FJ358_03625 [Thaumarchaeota archaeon]|nr:hypothetical protein [Nitrososphaerota archaeon]
MRKESELVDHLKFLGLNEGEAKIYVYLVQNGSSNVDDMLSRFKIKGKSAVESLISKGVIIKDPSSSSKVIPLHPRNAAANLYKLEQEKAIDELREKRKIADRLGMVLESAFEKSQLNR